MGSGAGQGNRPGYGDRSQQSGVRSHVQAYIHFMCMHSYMLIYTNIHDVCPSVHLFVSFCMYIAISFGMCLAQCLTFNATKLQLAPDCDF
ncbi:hypothetical protein M5D96_012088 [Drosophila gunungcola]|uniref:Uncharacterized protein n=1 Tax=Drosophila gunungcola TaxID=103775 RepID=A0A9P9YE76_9MUSC|nr:hypothetical protein M5D96_012088 [Drosophila gunungcola]